MRRASDKGFTLLESVLAIALMAGGLFGLVFLFHNSLGSAVTSTQTLQATGLARARVEQIHFDKDRLGYPSIVQANYSGIEGFTGDFAPFSRTTTILEVDSSNLTTPRNNSGYKRVTVSVTWPGANAVTLETLVTEWGAE